MTVKAKLKVASALPLLVGDCERISALRIHGPPMPKVKSRAEGSASTKSRAEGSTSASGEADLGGSLRRGTLLVHPTHGPLLFVPDEGRVFPAPPLPEGATVKEKQKRLLDAEEAETERASASLRSMLGEATGRHFAASLSFSAIDVTAAGWARLVEAYGPSGSRRIPVALPWGSDADDSGVLTSERAMRYASLIAVELLAHRDCSGDAFNDQTEEEQRLTRAACPACVLEGFLLTEEHAPAYPNWASIYVSARRPLPEMFRQAFVALLSTSEDLRRDVATWGVTFERVNEGHS